MDEFFDGVGDCDHCDAEDVPVVYADDPFIRDIYPDEKNEPSTWCEECYDRRCDDR